jgi:DinB superfamily
MGCLHFPTKTELVARKRPGDFDLVKKVVKAIEISLSGHRIRAWNRHAWNRASGVFCVEAMSNIMKHDLKETLALLARTPSVLDALLRDMPEIWVLRNEGEGTWNALDVVGHLIDADRVNWMRRARRVLESGETLAFEPFDRGGHARETQDRPLGGLLDEFARLRAENLAELRALNLQPRDLERRGQHPALGTITLSELLAAWAAHDLTHLHQISRIMASQYREAVGPWSRFLGVLHCAGHSASA